LCWLQASKADLDAAGQDQGAGPQGLHVQRRQGAAHRRFLAAAKQLAVVRKLLAPSLTLLLPPATNGHGKKPTRRRPSLTDRLATIEPN
jgi:hypothetical protein